MTLSTGALGRLQAGAWVAALVLGALALGHAVHVSDDVPFLDAGDAGRWITIPLPPTADLIASRPEAPAAFTFVRRFDGTPDPGRAPLRGRALRTLSLTLNGEPVAVPGDGTGWKRTFEVDVAPLVRDGRNELRATVRNVHGPPLLQLSLDLGDRRIETDTQWQVIGPRGEPVRAVVAKDTRIHPESRLLAPAEHVAAEHATALVGLLLLGAAATWLIATRRPAALRIHAPEIALAAVALFWLLVYALKGVRMPVMLGFDAHAHLLYIDTLVDRGTPPTAAEGFSNYHPPAFHAAAAALVALTGVTPDSPAGPAVYRLLPMLSGLATVAFTWAVARRLWPEDVVRRTAAVGVAGLLPMNVYMSAYVSNEALHAAWVSAALFLAIGAIEAPRPSPGRFAGLGAVLGLAMLTKFTSLAAAPLVAAFAAARVWVVDGRGPARAGAVGAGLLGVAALVAGWFYVRNWLLFGDPVVWNLDVPGAATWWMLPGFRTSESYLRFGESLRHPFFSGFASFWDGVYSTLWADGLVGGMIRVATRHPFWRYDWMTLVPALALPATALSGLGLVRLVAESFTDPRPARRLVISMLTTLLLLLGYSLLLITLRLPFYAQAKAPYVLAATLPLALCGAEGIAWTAERLRGDRLRPLLVAYGGWLGMLAGTIVLSFLG
jgi:hypothetical protein